MLIAHATDLTGDDDPAFVHATALAVAARAQLVTIHGNPAHAIAAELPDATALAARWGHVIAHDRRRHEYCEDIADTVLDALHELRADLVVVGTHGRHGFSALAHASIGATIARNLDCPVLIVPNRARGFVDAATGAVDLSRIVIPAGNPDEAQRGIHAARSLAAIAHTPGMTLELVHVGDDDPLLARSGTIVTRTQGKLEDAILAVAGARQACLIVMPTRGHDGVGDVLFGSHTERVIRDSSCPVLAVPITRR